MTTITIGPKDPDVAAALDVILTMYAAGEPTTPRYVLARFRAADIPLSDDVITEASRWVPFRPEPRAA